MTNNNPYLAGLELVKQHSGTSGQVALAKCILALYNSEHAFSIGEVLGPLDTLYTSVVMAMIHEYSNNGETAELRKAGAYVHKNFPGLVELSNAMSSARYEVRRGWEEERERQAEEEDRLEEEKRQRRVENASTMYCNYCKRMTKQMLTDYDQYECYDCGCLISPSSDPSGPGAARVR